MYRWMYICDRSRSVGAGRATTRNTRGLTRSVIALIVPPLPAVSRPSKTMQTFAPERLHPLLHGDQLAVQAAQLALVLLVLHPRPVRLCSSAGWSVASACAWPCRSLRGTGTAVVRDAARRRRPSTARRAGGPGRRRIHLTVSTTTGSDQREPEAGQPLRAGERLGQQALLQEVDPGGQHHERHGIRPIAAALRIGGGEPAGRVAAVGQRVERRCRGPSPRTSSSARRWARSVLGSSGPATSGTSAAANSTRGVEQPEHDGAAVGDRRPSGRAAAGASRRDRRGRPR